MSPERRTELVIAAYRAYLDPSHYCLQDAAEALSLMSDADQAKWFAVIEHLRAMLRPYEVYGDAHEDYGDVSDA